MNTQCHVHGLDSRIIEGNMGFVIYFNTKLIEFGLRNPTAECEKNRKCGKVPCGNLNVQ